MNPSEDWKQRLLLFLRDVNDVYATTQDRRALLIRSNLGSVAHIVNPEERSAVFFPLLVEYLSKHSPRPNRNPFIDLLEEIYKDVGAEAQSQVRDLVAELGGKAGDVRPESAHQKARTGAPTGASDERHKQDDIESGEVANKRKKMEAEENKKEEIAIKKKELHLTAWLGLLGLLVTVIVAVVGIIPEIVKLQPTPTATMPASTATDLPTGLSTHEILFPGPSTGSLAGSTTREATSLPSAVVADVSPTSQVTPTASQSASSILPSETAEALAAGRARYVPVALGSSANANTWFVSPPVGDISLGGIQFHLSGKVFKSQAAPSPDSTYPISIRLPVDVPRASQLHILMNSGNGFTSFQGKVIAKVIVSCDANEINLTDLVLGRDIREWHSAEAKVVSSASRPQQVWSGARSDHPELMGHIDMLSLSLPTACQTGRLSAIEIIDTSTDTVGLLDPAINVFGVTVETHH